MLDCEDFYIIYMIEEGEQYMFGEVQVEMVFDKFSLEGLLWVVGFWDGDLFCGDQIEDMIDMLIYVVGIVGYVFVDIMLCLEVDLVICKVNVIFVIDEGLCVYIECINIVGNISMLDWVICCELCVVEGDVFNCVLFDCLCNCVCVLGYFEEVEIIEKVGFCLDCMVVDLEVKEQVIGELFFVVGFFLVDLFFVDLFVFQCNLCGCG